LSKSPKKLPTLLKQALRAGRRGGRKLWRHRDRIHIALRELGSREAAELATALEAELGGMRGVEWVRVNAHLAHAIVACSPDEPGERDALEAALVEAVKRVEARLGLQTRPFPSAHPEQHPGDVMPLLRTMVEIGARLSALGTGAVLHAAGVRPPKYEIDLAAVVALIHNVPGLRKLIERYATIAGTELGLDLLSAVIYTLRQSETGPVMGVIHRTLRLRELHARRELWKTWEPLLCADPGAHHAALDDLPERPGPLREGPLQRYTDKASMAAMGAFGLGVVATGDVESASGLLFAGVPRPAYLGRNAFASHLGLRLAHAGILVMDPQVLRRLDRLDCAVIDASLLDGRSASRDLVRAVRQAGLDIVAVGAARAESEGLAWAGITEVTGPDVIKSVRELQRGGRGVCFVGRGPSPAYAAADCGIALWEQDGGVCWGAHILCPEHAQVVALLRATAVARQASEHSTHLAMAEAAVGMALSYTGLDIETTRHIMTAAHAASILTMGNAVRLAARVELPRHAGLPGSARALPWHRMDAREVLAALDSSEAGLPEALAARRRPAPPEEPSPAAHWMRMFIEELANPMAPILALGAGLSLLAGAFTDAALVAAALGVNGIFGGAQRYHIEKALRQLSQTEQRKVRVRRDGQTIQLDAAALAPGDVIELSAGDVVPADCRILDAASLEVDESSLTGESLPVAKNPAAIVTAGGPDARPDGRPDGGGAEPGSAQAEPDRAPAAPGSAQGAPDVDVAERTCMLYAETAVAAGTATAVVVAVGDDTEARRALRMGQREPRKNGVEHRLDQLISMTAPIAGAGGVALAAAGTLRGRGWRDVMGGAVSLAVAAVPEGLPLLATLAQLAAAGRLSKRGALVRNPRAIEALGRVDVLCADKTGTLTEGRIQLVVVSDGEIHQNIDALDDEHRRILAIALRASPPADGEPIPHLTDRALMDGARQADVAGQEGVAELERLRELPFEPSRGYHAGLARHESGHLISAKGAPEVILDRCAHVRRGGELVALDAGGSRKLIEQAHALARQGYRVLAVAEREASAPSADAPAALEEDRVSNLVFCGFVAFADPVRESARQAVLDMRRAGVEIVMVTGDHPSTAEAIAAELGLQNGAQLMTGADLDKLDDDALAAAVGGVGVFARVTPMHKVRIVRALQRTGRVVAMTGDGANDAPAIRLADVGIALGEGSTTAARQAADMVVTDERIETIVQAALEGRALWSSVRDAVSILVGGNLGEILYTVAGGLVSAKPPLNVRQLLLVNLVTDTFPALAIALRPPAHTSPEQLLREGPDVSLGDALTRDIIWRAVITASCASGAWLVARLGGKRGADTVGLLALTGSQLAQTLAVGGRSLPVIATSVGSFAALLAIVETPVVSHFFGCRPLGPTGLLQATAAMAASVGAYLVLPKVARTAAGQATGRVTMKVARKLGKGAIAGWRRWKGTNGAMPSAGQAVSAGDGPGEGSASPATRDAAGEHPATAGTPPKSTPGNGVRRPAEHGA
jgi:cation-transporting ATPase I